MCGFCETLTLTRPSLLYCGGRIHQAPVAYRMFAYDPTYGPLPPADPNDDGHGPDAPDALAPGVNLEVWAMQVTEVLSVRFPPSKARAGWTATYIFGNSLSTAAHLRQAEPTRSEAVA